MEANIFYTAASRLHDLDMRDTISRVFTNKGSLIGAMLHAQDDDTSEDSNPILEGEKHVVPCTFDVFLTRRPSAEELRVLGGALKFSGSELLEPYESLVERIRRQGGISFAIVSRHGGSHWLDGQPVQTPAVLDYVAAHLEKVAALARKRAEAAKARRATRAAVGGQR